jgi:hypothetical protein
VVVQAAVLAQAAESEPLLANWQAAGLSWGIQWVDLANGWQLGCWWMLGQLGHLVAATAPDGAQWTYGCDRWPDWTAGPDAAVLDPLRNLLTPGQRYQLEARLRGCCCWPAPVLRMPYAAEVR